MKKYLIIAVATVITIYYVNFVKRGKNAWRYAAAQSHIHTIHFGTETYIKKNNKPPSKIEDLVTSNIITQKQLDICLLQNEPVKVISTNDGEFLIKYQHPIESDKFFGVKMNGESATELIER